MNDVAPAVLALDFDGVLCDGRAEYFEAARRAYRATWPAAHDVPDTIAAVFGTHRPLVESGWEMPVLLHAIVAGEPERALVDRTAWLPTARRLLEGGRLTPETLGHALNRVRDEWFARDPDDWVRHNVFYPGIVARLLETLASGTPIAIVTTKAERFARALLAAQDARLAGLPIVGREPGRAIAKPESLTRLAAAHSLQGAAEGLWFVEDLLETLDAVHATRAGRGAPVSRGLGLQHAGAACIRRMEAPRRPALSGHLGGAVCGLATLKVPGTCLAL